MQWKSHHRNDLLCDQKERSADFPSLKGCDELGGSGQGPQGPMTMEGPMNGRRVSWCQPNVRAGSDRTLRTPGH